MPDISIIRDMVSTMLDLYTRFGSSNSTTSDNFSTTLNDLASYRRFPTSAASWDELAIVSADALLTTSSIAWSL